MASIDGDNQSASPLPLFLPLTLNSTCHLFFTRKITHLETICSLVTEKTGIDTINTPCALRLWLQEGDKKYHGVYKIKTVRLRRGEVTPSIPFQLPPSTAIRPLSHFPPREKNSRLRCSSSAGEFTNGVLAGSVQANLGLTSGISQIETGLKRCSATHCCGFKNQIPEGFLENCKAAIIFVKQTGVCIQEGGMARDGTGGKMLTFPPRFYVSIQSTHIIFRRLKRKRVFHFNTKTQNIY